MSAIAAGIRSCTSSAAFRCRTRRPCSAPCRAPWAGISFACPTARPASARPGSASCRTCSPTIPRSSCAKDVPPFKFVQWDGKVVREIPRLRLKPGATPDASSLQDRLCRHGDRILGPVRAAAEGRRHSGRSVKFQICMPTPIAPTYNNMVPSDRPKLLPALTQHFIGEVAEIAAGAAERPHRAAMGCVPGGAGLGGLLRRRARSTSAPRPSRC